ncbi:MAG: 4Fe-4S binding protein [Spirochaetia bacterium]|nr:4Fe-4S binding protein [Spirochaetia bacterium]
MEYLGINTLRFDVKKCTGCGMCVIVCPHRVFKMQGKKAAPAWKDKCIECGACKSNCAFGAIEVDAGPGCAAAVLAAKFGGKNVCCE